METDPNSDVKKVICHSITVLIAVGEQISVSKELAQCTPSGVSIEKKRDKTETSTI